MPAPKFKNDTENSGAGRKANPASGSRGVDRTLHLNLINYLPVSGLIVALGLAAMLFTAENPGDKANVVVLRGSDAGQIMAYESKIQHLKDAIQEANSRVLMARTALSAQISALKERQSQIEAQQAVLTTLTQALGPAAGAVRNQAIAAPRRINPLIDGKFGTSKARAELPRGASAYSETTELAPPDQPPTSGGTPAAANRQMIDWQPTSAIEPTRKNRDETELSSLSTQLSQLEQAQVAAVNRLGAEASGRLASERLALSEAGLDPEKLKPPAPSADATGGPFVAIAAVLKDSPFERALQTSRADIEAVIRVERLMPYIPLRRPASASSELTSAFGNRIDPFDGQLAMHTGVDFRLEYGAPVRPTAAGTVVASQNNGGYGNMVDIDHGNGIVTRYAHLSVILVKVGKTVNPDTIIGLAGSTGRSTGTHLHYEVRVNDEPVNPLRFIRAGAALALVN